MSLGVTNGVACFQRAMNDFIDNNNLPSTYAYLDNITICGKNQEDHDHNLDLFLKAAEKKNLQFNKSKCVFSTRSIKLLGYLISDGEIRPDPDRMQPLKDLPVPNDSKHLKQVVGLFSYYSKWIRDFSAKIKPLSSNYEFPMPQPAVDAFQVLKGEIEKSVVRSIDENVPFTVETLNQGGRPVAFFSRTLQKSELKQSSVEKEACAIVEPLRHWQNFLIGRRFILITDQKSVSYMFDGKRVGKIKNNKILRWRTELACYNFDIIYRRGELNVPADTLTRSFFSAITTDLVKLHNALCHPGITRFNHFTHTKNIPASLEEIKTVVKDCKTCAKGKPRFYRPPTSHLIKATQPFERLNIDFKGPLPSTTRNIYILTVIDEYSRFPFAIP